MSRGRTQRHMGTRVSPSSPPLIEPMTLLVEEPLEIRLGDQRVGTTMRTPGHDFELAVGFCLSEGYLTGTTVRKVRYCATGSAADTGFNVVTVEISTPLPPITPRSTHISSSCGLCGSDQIDEMAARMTPLPETKVVPSSAVLANLGAGVAKDQSLFDSTGGSHAAVAFDLGSGALGAVREDVGRHNAVDKVVGQLVLGEGVPATGKGLWVSGRASFEIVQKAWAAGFSLLVSVSAPSTMALGAARRGNLGLVGFARSGRFTVYHLPAGWSIE